VSTAALLRTALYAVHRRLEARIVDFAGWEMPVQYPRGILAEHQAVRSACGLFDLSHMGRVFLRGPDALQLAQRCTTRDLARVGHGQAAYTLVCREDGGILDDVIAYRLDAEEVLFVFNASNRESDIAWFQQHADGLHVQVDDQTFDTALIGVQGPRAQDLLQPLSPADLDRLPGYSFVSADVAGRPALVARTGYTGEDGFEVMVRAEDAERVWDALVNADGVPAGLGARDTLRTEAGMALYGHEIDTTTNPFEARLGWVVNLAKDEFIGREALSRIKDQGPTRRLVGLLVEAGGVPRPGFPLLRDGQVVGKLTSGTFSPTLKRNIALGYVPTGIDDGLAIEMRGKAVPAQITKLPFVPHRTRPRATM
jgi:glycine cleavage system T protein (aminomethyltransferase)